MLSSLHHLLDAGLQGTNERLRTLPLTGQIAEMPQRLQHIFQPVGLHHVQGNAELDEPLGEHFKLRRR